MEAGPRDLGLENSKTNFEDFPNPVCGNSVLQQAAGSGLAKALRSLAQAWRGRGIHPDRFGEGITVVARWLQKCCCRSLASRKGHAGRRLCKHLCASSTLRPSDVQLRRSQARTNLKIKTQACGCYTVYNLDLSTAVASETSSNCLQLARCKSWYCMLGDKQ